MRLERQSVLSDHGVERAADIADGKGREWLRGIDVTCLDMRVSDLFTGTQQAKSTGHMLDRFRLNLEGVVEAHRNEKKHKFEAREPEVARAKAVATKDRSRRG